MHCNHKSSQHSVCAPVGSFGTRSLRSFRLKKYLILHFRQSETTSPSNIYCKEKAWVSPRCKFGITIQNLGNFASEHIILKSLWMWQNNANDHFVCTFFLGFSKTTAGSQKITSTLRQLWLRGSKVALYNTT